MKKSILLIISFLIASLSFGQNVLSVTTSRMGPFKILMKKCDVEKVLNKKLQLKFDKNNNPLPVDVNYKDINLKFEFSNQSFNENPDSLEIFTISTKDTRVKTPSGLGVGNTKMHLINAYSDKYEINIYSPYEQNHSTGEYEKSKLKRRFSLNDNELSTHLNFDMMNNEVVEISLEYYEGC